MPALFAVLAASAAALALVIRAARYRREERLEKTIDNGGEF